MINRFGLLLVAGLIIISNPGAEAQAQHNSQFLSKLGRLKADN